MSRYKANIRPQENQFYALVVRVDRDGEENVCHGYAGRFFKTKAAAEKSTARYIAKVA